MDTYNNSFQSIFKTRPIDNDIFQTKFLWCWCCLYDTHDYAI